MEEVLANLSFQMALPEVVSNHEKLQSVTDQFQKTEKQVHSLYEEWERLAEEISS